MRLLLSNDDGIDAPGLGVLTAALEDAHQVWVVAPATEQSARSHSLTMHDPLRLYPRGPRRFAVGGTPADAVYVALHHLLEQPPDLVLSGINHGSNLGSDVHYSGTVAAAREATLHGHQAVALSLHREPGDVELFWDTAARVAVRVAEAVRRHPIPPGVLLNVNVPNVPLPRLRGLKTCRLGDRVYERRVEERQDPRGKSYLWIGGPHLHFGPDPDTDGPAVEQGWATVTPLSAVITAHGELERLRDWTDA